MQEFIVYRVDFNYKNRINRFNSNKLNKIKKANINGIFVRKNN